jgi:hypothetical protein
MSMSLKSYFVPLRRLMVPLAVATLMVGAAPLGASAQEKPDGSPPMEQMHEHMHGHMHGDMHEPMEQKMQEHLDHLAARLEIRASQQEAWNGFAAAVKGMAPAHPREEPARDLDAAARARLAADHAAEMARKLSTLADATGKLQQVLDGPQKQVLNEVSREFGHRMHGHGHGDGEGPMGMHHEMHEHEHCDGDHEHGHEGHDGHDGHEGH